MKKLKFTFLLIVLMSMFGAKIYAHDIEVQNADGLTIYYVWTNNNTELAVSYRGDYYDLYSNRYTGNVVIPESVNYEGKTYNVTSIGECAFRTCSGLTSITIPCSVTSIGDYAFLSCSSLSSITIPYSVTEIGHHGIDDCPRLTSVNISVIDLAAFCNNNIVYYLNSVIGKLIRLIDNEGKEIKDYIIPSGVTSIRNHAFYGCTGLTSITIPNSVTSIGEEAFSDCTGLNSVTISGSVTEIGNRAFLNCTGLTSVNISVTDLATFCNNKIVYYLNSAIGKPIRLIDAEGKEIKEYIIPNSVTEIGDRAFYSCSSLTSITIPNSVTSIGYSAFEGCSSLNNVNIPNSVLSISGRTFSGCTSLTRIIIGNSVTSIGSEAFYNTYLKSVTIGAGVLTIGNGAFGYGNDNIPIKVIWLTNTPPNGYYNAVGIVNYVANDSYSYLNNKMIYPFLSSLFEVDGVKYVPVSPSERTCDAIDCAYNESTVKINIGKAVSYKGVQMSVKNVNQYVCCENPYIKDVDLSFDGNLSNYAFKGCSGMKTVTLGKKITSIGQGAFSECKQLQNIVIPDAVMSLGSNAFQNCTSMTSVNIGTGIKTINEYTFANCTSMTDIQIPHSVTEIQDNVFSGCKSLKTVIMDDQETELKLGSNGGSPLFADCPLNSVYIGRNISYSTDKNSGYSPFYRNTTLRSVTITDKETEISPNEFYGCTNLKNVSIGDGVTTIGDWAFSGCSSLDFFAFGRSVKTIGQEAFSDCTAMTRLISRAATPPTCGSQALDDINKWNCTLSVPTGATTAYQQAEQWKEFFFINNDMTGISRLTNTNVAPNHIYELNGRKLKEPSKGINIIGGKKVIVK